MPSSQSVLVGSVKTAIKGYNERRCCPFRLFCRKALRPALSGTKPSGVLSVVLTDVEVLCLGFSSRASFTRLRSKQRQPTKAKGKVFGNNEVEVVLHEALPYMWLFLQRFTFAP